MTRTLDTTHGRARINVVDIHHDTSDFLAIEIDMHSKYIEPIIAGGYDEPAEIILMAFERALHLDESTDRQTTITLPEHTRGWCVVVQGGRYTIQIVAWRRPFEENG